MAKKKKTEKDDDAIGTQKDAAKYCNVSDRTIRNWEKEYTLKDADGNYIKQKLDELKSNGGNLATAAKERTLFAEADYKGTKAQLLEMELKERQGQLIPRADIERQRIERIISVKRILLSFSRKLPAMLKAKTMPQMAEIIRREIHHVLNTFAGKTSQPESGIEATLELYESLTPLEKAKFKTKIATRKKTAKKKKK